MSAGLSGTPCQTRLFFLFHSHANQGSEPVGCPQGPGCQHLPHSPQTSRRHRPPSNSSLWPWPPQDLSTGRLQTGLQEDWWLPGPQGTASVMWKINKDLKSLQRGNPAQWVAAGRIPDRGTVGTPGPWQMCQPPPRTHSLAQGQLVLLSSSSTSSLRLVRTSDFMRLKTMKNSFKDSLKHFNT